VVETWRTCLQDELELDALKTLLREVREETIRVEEVTTQTPSPFAGQLGWMLTNQHMYEDDTPGAAAGGPPGLRPDLLQELVFSAQLRPRLPAELVERFRRKVQRTSPGYAPRDAAELLAWIDERVLMPESEWRELLDAMRADHGLDETELTADVAGRVLWVTLPGAAEAAATTAERVARTLRPAVGLDGLTLRAIDDPRRPPPEDAAVALDVLLARAPATAEDADPLAELVAEWLRFQGPLPPPRLETLFGLDAERLRDVLETLRESQRVVIDQLVRGSGVVEVCDGQNLEVLLRWLRREGRPEFTALPADALPLFLARHQGLAPRGGGLEDLQERLEKLFGYAAPAAAWEAEILPARLEPYYPSWLDSLMQESDLVWFGGGPQRVAFAFPVDLELFQETADDEATDALFPQARGRYTLAELAAHSGRTTAELADELWRLAWAGRVTNDAFAAVRKGVENKWQPVEPAAPRAGSRPRVGRRAAFRSWQATRPFSGRWFVLDRDGEPRDALEEEELNKDRARVLLQRYGVVFRELLAREPPSLQWGRVFRSLRLMELSGEVLAGHFFEGVGGLQFTTPFVFRELRHGLPEDAIFWLNAADPASLCGVDVAGLKETLPPRHATTHLVFHGRRLALVSRRRGKELDVRVGADHPHLPEYLGVLKTLLTREFRPLRSIVVERVNGEPAAESAYAAVLGSLFRVVREQHHLKLWKRYGESPA
ncbi:MAG TPA: ATP-dependent helicase, partial [Thermoanaerobaculia bacterium]